MVHRSQSIIKLWLPKSGHGSEDYHPTKLLFPGECYLMLFRILIPYVHKLILKYQINHTWVSITAYTMIYADIKPIILIICRESLSNPGWDYFSWKNSMGRQVEFIRVESPLKILEKNGNMSHLNPLFTYFWKMHVAQNLQEHPTTAIFATNAPLLQ